MKGNILVPSSTNLLLDCMAPLLEVYHSPMLKLTTSVESTTPGKVHVQLHVTHILVEPWTTI